MYQRQAGTKNDMAKAQASSARGAIARDRPELTEDSS